MKTLLPGFILILHTFGRDLKWNPHIHCILSEGGAGNFSVWRPVKHFDYTLLRNAFCTALLNEMEKAIGPSFNADSLECPNCSETMEVFEIWYKKTALFDQLRKLLGKPP